MKILDRTESWDGHTTTRRLLLRKDNGEIVARHEREDATNKIIDETTEIGTSVHHREHRNGALDGKVKLNAIRIRLVAGATPNVEHVRAIGALQEASEVYLIAKHSGNEQWRRHARGRLDAAAVRLQETQ